MGDDSVTMANVFGDESNSSISSILILRDKLYVLKKNEKKNKRKKKKKTGFIGFN